MRSLAGGTSDVDHFIPWWRYPTDLGHNFVLAHASCNRQKSDRLAAEPHLERWAERNWTHGPGLAAEFDLRRVRHDLTASKRIARWAYGHAAGLGSLVWVRGREVAPLGPGWEPLIED
jgi:CRISPR/Cas system Type II protein with McrA/HNH and RuvC-like nuclease domain